MKFIFYCLLIFSSVFGTSYAQTWTGNQSTDWNTAGNWNPANIPLAAGNVTIPTAPAGNRWPKLAVNTTVGTLTMQAGAQLDVNGFTLTVNSMDIRGVLSNSNVGTDIECTITGSGTSYIRNTTVSDNIKYTLSGTGVFYDNYLAATANTYTGSANYMRTGTGATYISVYSRNTYGGNVTISNSVASLLSAFEAGSNIAGNLSFTSVGGTAEVGDLGANTIIAGTLSISASGNNGFGVYRVINNTTGGSIDIANRSVVNLEADTLKVNNINITQATQGISISRNQIVGNLSLSTSPGNTATTFIRNLVLTGSASYIINGTSTFYDNYLAGTANSYSGNVSYTRNANGPTYISFYARNQYGGNVIINGTVAAIIDAFEKGSDIAGNLSFTSVGGTAEIGDNGSATIIGGTINVSGTTSNTFGIYGVTNLTNGGSINLSNRGVVNLENDTLKVNSITIAEATQGMNIQRNKIEGNFSLSTSAANTATTYIRSLVLTGNATYTLNGTSIFYDNYLAGSANNYLGNVSYTRNANGPTYISFYARNHYGGNVTIANTVPSELDAFQAGSDIAGNLSFTSVGGTAEIGENGSTTIIGGTINVSGTTSNGFGIYRVTNQTSGGNISLTDRWVNNIENCNLKASGISISNATQGMSITNNTLAAIFGLSTAAANSATVYIRNNVVTGNATFTHLGTGTLYDTYLSNTGNTYMGNVSYLRTGTGPMYVGYYDTVTIGASLTFNYNTGAAADNRYFAFNGSSASVINQDGNSPLQFYGLVMQKSNGATVTLNDSLRIVDNINFITGNLVTANQKELIILSGAIVSGANDASKVLGPVVKIGAQLFTFPVGGISHLQAVNMTAPSGATSRFRCEYVFANPHPTYDTSKRAAGLAAVSGCEYWIVLRDIGTTNVSLTFDYGAPCLCVEVPANLRVAKWNGAQWANLGNGGITGNLQSGTVKPTAAVVEYGVFTLGSSATVAPLVSITRNVANPVCVCRWVTFTATPVSAGCNPLYQWKKNGQNVGANAATYSDSALVQGDVISVVVTSSAAFASPGTVTSNSFSITTTDTNSWTGLISTNWHSAGNWSCESVPCTLSKVVVNGGTPNACEILSGNIKVITLTTNSGGTVRILNGSALELKQP